jgi:adenylylsulfate kinase-like enzyme
MPPATPLPGATVWLTGPPSAGKSTVALAAAEKRRADVSPYAADRDALKAESAAEGLA